MSRAKWKNPFNIYNKKKLTNNKIIQTKKKFEITPNLVGYDVKVYNGQVFVKLSITEDMLGHKIGEFIPTREKFLFKKKRKLKK